jgi:hypothetical protein
MISRQLTFDFCDPLSDNPWNQTPADNLDWLEEFKRSVGLAETENLGSNEHPDEL